LAKDESLSDIGRRQKLAELGKAEAKNITKAKAAIDDARDRMRDQRRGLLPRVTQKDDMAAAHVRSEIRAHLKTLNRADVARLLDGSDSELMLAVAEAPAFLSGLDVATRDEFLERAIEKANPKALDNFIEAEEALATTGAALRMAGEAVRVAVD